MGTLSVVQVRQLGLQPYRSTYDAMRAFSAARNEETPDEIWLVQHPPVYTQGRNGKAEHLTGNNDIPIEQIDRGGQITYHGPGQLVVYLLLDLRRLKLGVKALVHAMEQSVIALLADYGIEASARPDAPGVYVQGAKVAALGLRIKRGCSYHGLSLNIDMDLAPFAAINPCGHPGMDVTTLRRLGITKSSETISQALLGHLKQQLPL